jgi:release factor glutamine methyltransferase
VNNDIEDASLESELLLRHTLGIDRVQFYQNLEQCMTIEQQDLLQKLLQRRLRGEPFAYIRSYSEFYGLNFYVNNNVLIPRPETEILIDILLNQAQEYRRPYIADVGTGCGNIAISVALNLPQADIYAMDISAPALKVARLNCYRYGVTNRIMLLQGDLLQPLLCPVNFIIANLPYVKHSELDNHSYEPHLALDGGTDGLKSIRRLGHQVKGKLLPGGCLLMEIGKGHKKAVVAFINKLFPTARIEVIPDLGGIDRIVSMILPR